MAGIHFENIKGLVLPQAMDYYIFCGEGSCSDFTFRDVHVMGGNKTSSCNFRVGGCPNGIVGDMAMRYG